MPWHYELKKDATNGETRRGVVRTQRSGDIRMGEPSTCNEVLSMSEYIAHERATQGIETSQYLEEKKTTVILLVAASEKGRAQTNTCVGVVGLQRGTQIFNRMALKGQPKKVQVLYMKSKCDLVES